MGPLAKLIPAETEIAVHTTGFPCGPAAVANSIGRAVAGKCLDLAVDLQTLHGTISCVERRHQRSTLGRIALNQLLALDVPRDHRLLGHAATTLCNEFLTIQSCLIASVINQLLHQGKLAGIPHDQNQREAEDQNETGLQIRQLQPLW